MWGHNAAIHLPLFWWHAGGYYAIQARDRRTLLLILNTSLYEKRQWIGANEEDPAGTDNSTKFNISSLENNFHGQIGQVNLHGFTRSWRWQWRWATWSSSLGTSLLVETIFMMTTWAKIILTMKTFPGKMERYMSSRFGHHAYQDQFNKR